MPSATDLSAATFVLGADDPEMTAIRDQLMQRGLRVIDAKDAAGVRVNPRTAYQADPANWPAGVVLVECAPVGGPRAGDIVIDHHDPRVHPAARLGPADYWQAASIGQLWRMLAGDAAPPDHLRLVVAMDHCLPAAYAGQCPGIDPRDVFERDLINVAGAPGGHGDPEYIRRLINEASARIAICPVIDMAGQAVYDGRDLPPTPPGYSAEALAVTKATCRDGVALLACAADADGRRKLTLGGACHPATVEHFMTVWAPAHGLTGIYGVPARGYAGGYLSD